MRPPPKSSLEMQSDEEHVRQLELLPSVDGNTLIDRRELGDVDVDDEHRRTWVLVEDIHLSPKSSTSSTKGEEPESGTQSDLRGHNTVPHLTSGAGDGEAYTDISHTDEARSEHNPADLPSLPHVPSTSEKRAPLPTMLDDDEEINNEATEDSLSANGSEIPESPNSPPSQDNIKNEGRRTSVTVIIPTRYTQKLIGSLEKSREMQDRARTQTPVQMDEHPVDSDSRVDTEKEENTESEDESQLQKDTRIPKRRLSEIENEEPTVKQKMAKVDDEQSRHTILRNIESTGKPATAPKIVLDVTQTSVMIDTSLDTASKQSEETSKVSPLRNKGKQRQTLGIAAHYPAIVETPIRRSSRKSGTPVSSSSAPQNGPEHVRPKIVFSSGSQIAKETNVLSTIEKLGGIVVKTINDANILCIGSNILRKTGKFVIAVARGVDIVTDDWIREAQRNQAFPPCKDFLPQDRRTEEEWGFSLSKALKRKKSVVRLLLHGVDLYLTTQVRKDLGNLTKDLEQVALALGVVKVHNGLPRKIPGQHVLVIGSTKNIDPQGTKVNRLGYKLYMQDLLTMGVLRGELDTSSNEFVIDVPVKDEPASSQ